MELAPELQSVPANHRMPYDGLRRKLVVAFDIGTTFSGASYSILDPGSVPTVHGVNAFPYSRTAPSERSKVPSVIYYDKQEKTVAVGGEAVRLGIENEAVENDWVKAEWFKLHLWSKEKRQAISFPSTDQLSPLPPNKTVVEVYGDYLRYMMACTARYIQDTNPSGLELWKSVKDDIDFILTHPNDWDEFEVSQMSLAIVHSGLIEDTEEGHARVSFLQEGRASLQLAIELGIVKDTHMKPGDGVVVVDAGGATIGVSAYGSYVTGASDLDKPGGSLAFMDAISQNLYFQGSAFVTARAVDYLKAELAESKYLMDIEHIRRCFDESTKVFFRDSASPQYIRFGSSKDNDPQVGIRLGQLKLPGTVVANFFEPSVNCIVDAVKTYIQDNPGQCGRVIFTGGLSSNQWLFERVSEGLATTDMEILRVDYANKATANGAVAYYLDRSVHSKETRAAYGTINFLSYDPQNPVHFARRGRVKEHAGGQLVLPLYFGILVKKGVQIPAEHKDFTKTCYASFSDLERLRNVSHTMTYYTGDRTSPDWVEDDPTHYFILCTNHADMSSVDYTTEYDPTTGAPYYKFDFNVVLCFQRDRLFVFLEWKNREGIWDSSSKETILL